MRRLLPAVFAAAALLAGCTKDEPDLAVGTITATPVNPQPGDTITITLPVTNRGATGAGGSTWSVNRDSVHGFATGTLPALDQGASATISFPVTETDAGSHTYQVIANVGNDFSEEDFGNNSASVVVTFALPIDLQAAPLTVDPVAPTTATPITITSLLTNAASAPGTATAVVWRVQRDGVDNYTSGIIPTLAPGAAIAVPFTVPLETVGTHTYIFTIDPDGRSTDTDRSSNVQTITVTVAAVSG